MHLRQFPERLSVYRRHFTACMFLCLLTRTKCRKGRSSTPTYALLGRERLESLLAREFIDAPFRTCLLESGGLEYDAATQELYRGRNVGRKYFDLDACRLRYFGGTTNHWAGWCRPLNAIDFEDTLGRPTAVGLSG